MNLKRFFIIDNYAGRVRAFQKKMKIRRLEQLKFSSNEINQIWNIDENKNLDFPFDKKKEYSIFGIIISLEEEINWHQDKFSGFTYPLRRFDKINAVQYFDEGIELVFPWEQSRFYFAINLAKKYLASKDVTYYNLFKKLVLDWIEKNPFLYGVNWLSTMDVSIRTVNWIIAINLFYQKFNGDKEFTNEISKSMTAHAEYIYSFPLIEKGGLTTNHTTSAYTGLLFLALSLSKHPKAKLWLKTAVEGLEKCIEDQVYEDGVDFEGSIPYHRLVLELFAYSAIAVLSNNIKFSKNFYNKLFKMFEFTAAYIDKNGNAPQAGDNDSGRLLIFNDVNNDPYLNEHDHSYLLKIGEYIFNYKFKSSCQKTENNIINYLPAIKKIEINNLNLTGIPRDTEKSISFKNGGAYFLKNENFNLMLTCFPMGQKGKGGHNHLDTGSFTLSINGKPVIVDPGTFCYTRDRKQRDKFRSYIYHNTLHNDFDKDIGMLENGFWSLKEYYKPDILHYKENQLKIRISQIYDKKKRYRSFNINDKQLYIKDEYEGTFFSRFNFHHELTLEPMSKNEIGINGFILKSSSSSLEIIDYEYSDFYGQYENAKALIINSEDILEVTIGSSS